VVLQLGGLRGAARRALFKQYTFGVFTKGMTSTSILEGAKSIGLGIRKTDALRIINEVAGRQVSADRMKFVTFNRVPSLKNYTPTDWNLSHKFQTIFEVEGTNVLTDAPMKRKVSFMSDERVTVGEMKRILDQKIRDSEGPSGVILPLKLTIKEGLQRAETPFVEEA